MTPTTKGEEVVGALRRFISRGEYGLKEVPQLVKEVLREGYWRERSVPFEQFVDFVEHPPMEGLGADIETLERLCGHDTDARSLIDKATQGKRGRPPKNGNNVTNKRQRPEGNTAAKAIRRLRDKRPDLHARVLTGELTPHGAARLAGFRPPTATVRLDDMASAAATLRNALDAKQIAELVRLLEGEVG